MLPLVSMGLLNPVVEGMTFNKNNYTKKKRKFKEIM